MKLIFPAAVLTQHIIALGKTGSGKSSVIRYVIEEIVGDSSRLNPICILDVKGDWWGLKYSATGRGVGVETVIFGGLHADIPITPGAGAAVGEIVATSAFVCIIDISEFSMGERTRFVVDFFGTLFRKSRGQRFLVLDECHNFVPQGKIMDPLSGQMLHWGNRLASEGRGKGITLIAASQRPQKVHKDFLTSCETLIAMRVIHKLDRKAVSEWLDGAPDQEAAKQVLADLANVKRGTGWMWSPEIGFGPKLIEFPRFKTYDSFAPQAEGAELKALPAPEEVAALRDHLRTFIEQAEANDPKMLKKRIADLEDQLEKAGHAEPPEDYVPESRLLEVRGEGFQEGREEGYQIGLKAAWSEIGRRMIKTMQFLQMLDNARADAAQALESQSNRLADLTVELEQMQELATSPPESHMTEYPAHLPPASRPPPKPAVSRASNGDQERLQKFSRGLQASLGTVTDVRERKILSVLAQNQGRPLTKAQINALAGYRSSGKVSTAYATITRNGWMGERGVGHFAIEPAGLKALGEYEPLPTGRRLREQLLHGNRLNVREKAILKVLVEHGGQPVAKGKILEIAGYQSSGKVSTAFARLQLLGYAQPAGVGALAASKELF